MSNYIDRILASTWYPAVCKSQDDYKVLAKNLHPDINTDAKAVAAFTHLNQLKTDFEKGIAFQDESGEYRSNYLYTRWKGDKGLLEISKTNYDKIIFTAKSNLDAKSFEHFMQYIPASLDFEGNELVCRTNYKSIPLSKVIPLLPPSERNKHVNWIYSRMIEFTAMLESMGITHAGLNPDSVFIVPETHGIQVVSFYHVCTSTIKTVNAKYKNYYPHSLFHNKTAGAYVDINLVKKTAIAALGDVSGSGVKLRAGQQINQEVLNYLMLPESEAFRSMRGWREVLNKNFIKEFVPLNV